MNHLRLLLCKNTYAMHHVVSQLFASSSFIKTVRRDRLDGIRCMLIHHLRQSDRLIRIHAHKSAFFFCSFAIYSATIFLPFCFYYIDFRRKRFLFNFDTAISVKTDEKTFTIKRFIFSAFSTIFL